MKGVTIMNLKLAHAISVLVVLFTMSLTAYGCENNPAHKTTHDPVNIDPALIAMADKILADQAEASITDGGNFGVASNTPDSVLSTEGKRSSVSRWLDGNSFSGQTLPRSQSRH
jgi:hypothetical protein